MNEPSNPSKEEEKRKEKEFEEDARNSLLAHYSSKSTNQTAILLGLAIVFFADIQVALNLSLKGVQILFLVPSVALIIFIGVRAIGKLILWGELASGVMQFNMAESTVTQNYLHFGFQNQKTQDSIKEVKNYLKKYNPEHAPEWSKLVDESIEKLAVFPTYMMRLAMSAQLFYAIEIYGNKQSVRSLILRFNDTKYLKYVCFLVVPIAFAVFWWLFF